MRYHHITSSWNLPLARGEKKIKNKAHNHLSNNKKANMLVFSEIIILTEGNFVYTVDERYNLNGVNENMMTSEEG